MERAGKQGRIEGILTTSPETSRANQNQNQNPPFVIPPPKWDGPSLGPKRIGNTSCRRHRRKIFFRFYWNWGLGGPSLADCPPPPPQWGDQPDSRVGITKGVGGSRVLKRGRSHAATQRGLIREMHTTLHLGSPNAQPFPWLLKQA